jgi:hypothetical protein
MNIACRIRVRSGLTQEVNLLKLQRITRGGPLIHGIWLYFFPGNRLRSIDQSQFQPDCNLREDSIFWWSIMDRLSMDGFSRFASREEAGDALARILAGETLVNPVVLALPRGGVPIGLRCAKAINAPLDLLMVRKIGVPWQPELATGSSGTVLMTSRYHRDPNPRK